MVVWILTHIYLSVGRAEGIQVGMLSRNVSLSVWNTSADV